MCRSLRRRYIGDLLNILTDVTWKSSKALSHFDRLSASPSPSPAGEGDLGFAPLLLREKGLGDEGRF
ncbi:hypothetical protein [Pseudanabaena yagii]|uniref:Uncharacterized protein n=1 Tax=Pseudanabaena yagii GIHE-NHR1 TaxID=2722753 RepID=A0ABX1LPV7_9CYAN|nr:hypothetical protein [Pseudanabaena yagii]NMF58144.1 hypothetical protein [Pseudanabaena yagii GIHE-NHR1]